LAENHVSDTVRKTETSDLVRSFNRLTTISVEVSISTTLVAVIARAKRDTCPDASCGQRDVLVPGRHLLVEMDGPGVRSPSGRTALSVRFVAWDLWDQPPQKLPQEDLRA